jgi:hypothetical protein
VASVEMTRRSPMDRKLLFTHLADPRNWPTYHHSIRRRTVVALIIGLLALTLLAPAAAARPTLATTLDCGEAGTFTAESMFTGGRAILLQGGGAFVWKRFEWTAPGGNEFSVLIDHPHADGMVQCESPSVHGTDRTLRFTGFFAPRAGDG